MNVFEYTLIRVIFSSRIIFSSSFFSSRSLDTMINRETQVINMGRGAYDTTGVPKPPPRPKPQ